MQEGKKRGNFRWCCNIFQKGRGTLEEEEEEEEEVADSPSTEWNLSNKHTQRELMGKQVAEA